MSVCVNMCPYMYVRMARGKIERKIPAKNDNENTNLRGKSTHPYIEIQLSLDDIYIRHLINFNLKIV